MPASHSHQRVLVFVVVLSESLGLPKLLSCLLQQVCRVSVRTPPSVVDSSMELVARRTQRWDSILRSCLISFPLYVEKDQV